MGRSEGSGGADQGEAAPGGGEETQRVLIWAIGKFQEGSRHDKRDIRTCK